MNRIVPATLEDVPALVRLLNRAYRGEVARQGWTHEADLIEGEARTDVASLAGLLARPQAVMLLYTAETGEPAGCVFLENRVGRLYLGMLSVDPERQAQGIGNQLLQAASEQARQWGCRAIFMSVISVRDELIAWYERHGYAATGKRMPFDSPPQFGRPRRPLEFVELEKTV